MRSGFVCLQILFQSENQILVTSTALFYDVVDGSRQIGPRQIGPWQIGPLTDLAANWAPHFLGPNLPFFGKSGPGRLGPLAANWAPANRAPADWAPWRQIGPLGNFVAANWAPENFGCGKLGPGNFVGGKSGPGRLGPLAANWAPANGAPGKFGCGKLGPIMIFGCFWSLHNCLLCNSCHAILC